MTYEVDWSDHPKVHELDDWVTSRFNLKTRDEFFDSAYKSAYCIRDLKSGAKSWAEEYIELFRELLEKVEALPDDEQTSYTMKEETDEVVKDEEVLE